MRKSERETKTEKVLKKSTQNVLASPITKHKLLSPKPWSAVELYPF